MRNTILALLLLLTRAAFASCPSPVLLPGTTLPAPTNPIGIVVADLDKDGKNDYAVSGTAGFIVVYRGNGDGTFRAAENYNISGDHPSTLGLVTGDFNRDSWPDLAAIETTNSDVVVMLNKGDGTFDWTRVPSGDTNLKAVESGDIDGDKNPDLIVTGLHFGVLFGDGKGAFSTARTFPAPNAGDPAHAMAADLNHDGSDEIVGIYHGYPAERSGIAAFSRSTETLFSPHVLLEAPIEYSDKAYAADLNNDGFLDIITVHWSQDVRVFLNDGSGNLLPPATWKLDQVPQGAVAVDLDQDNDLDLVFGTINATPSVVPAMLGNGNGTFQLPFMVRPIGYPAVNTSLPTYQIYSLGAGDIDGDGRPDILLVDAMNNEIHVMNNRCPRKQTTTTLTQDRDTTTYGEYTMYTVTVKFEDGGTPTGRFLEYDNGVYRTCIDVNASEPGVLRLHDAYPLPGDHIVRMLFAGTDDYAPSEASVKHTVLRIDFGPPQNFQASGNNGGASVLQWVKAADSGRLEISRLENGKWSVIGSTTEQTYWDTTIDASKGYFYRVRAFKASDPTVASGYTMPDAALGHFDGPWPGEIITAKVLQDLRDGADKLRDAAGLKPYDFSDRGVFGKAIKKTHLVELQTALNEAYVAAGGVPWPYSPITEGVTAVKAIDFYLIGLFMW